MKYLENLALENLTKSITNRELGGGLVIHGKVELYSTKKAGDDKKQSKMLESKFADSSAGPSAVKSDVTIKTKKVLGDLIQTMNCSMVDYDFSELTPDSFTQVNTIEAVQDINSHLAEITVSSPTFINELWRDISDAMVSLSQCETYKLIDSNFIDEVESGTAWSFNYFFCSKEHKRVLYFTCMAASKYRKLNPLGLAGDADSEDEDDDGEEEAMDTSDGGREGEESEDEDIWA